MPENNHIAYYCKVPTLSRRIWARFLFFSLIWFILTGSEVYSWILGLPAVALAVYISITLSYSSYCSISLLGALGFIPFFLRQSSHSGIDVMRRSLSFHIVINPGLVSYSTFLPEGAPRTFFVNTISLLPGTLSADLQEDTVVVHTIDKDLAIWANIQNLEFRIALLFGVSLSREEIK